VVSRIKVGILVLVVIVLATACVNVDNAPASPNGNNVDLFADKADIKQEKDNSLCTKGKADLDSDGYCGDITQDCDDTDPTINPNSEEKCDGIDNDCDGKIDEGCVPECYDECSPEGTFCSGITLKKCMNFDDDPCLELVSIECTYGCAGVDTCRDSPAPSAAPTEEDIVFMRPADRPATSDVLDAPIPYLSNQTCEGEFIGNVEWLQDGSVCKRPGYGEANPGYIQPMHCCNRYFSDVTVHRLDIACTVATDISLM